MGGSRTWTEDDVTQGRSRELTLLFHILLKTHWLCLNVFIRLKCLPRYALTCLPRAPISSALTKRSLLPPTTHMSRDASFLDQALGLLQNDNLDYNSLCYHFSYMTSRLDISPSNPPWHEGVVRQLYSSLVLVVSFHRMSGKSSFCRGDHYSIPSREVSQCAQTIQQSSHGE